MSIIQQVENNVLGLGYCPQDMFADFDRGDCFDPEGEFADFVERCEAELAAGLLDD